MEIQLWKKILTPYELAVQEILVKFNQYYYGVQVSGHVFSYRGSQRQGKKHIKHS